MKKFSAFTIVFLITLILPMSILRAVIYNYKSCYFKGREAARVKNWEEAILQWKSCCNCSDITLNQRARINFSLSKAFEVLGDNYKAIGYAKRALKLAPDNVKIADLLKVLLEQDHCLTCERQNVTDDSAISFTEAQDLFKDGLLNESIAKGAGSSLLEEAVAFFKKHLHNDDTKLATYSYYALGVSYFINGSNEQAIIHLEKSLGIDPKNSDAHHYLGEVYLEMNDANKAMEHLELYIKYGGDSLQGSAALVKAYGITNNKGKKDEIVDLVTKIAASNINLARNLSTYFEDKGMAKQIDKIVGTAKKNQESSYGSSSKSGSSQKTRTPPKRAKNRRKKEKAVEKTQKQKNYDVYNKNRYRQYITHLNRLQKGQPTSWSGAIPKRPETKK